MLMQNIVLPDASEVDHTFVPVSLVGNLGTFQDQSLDRVADWPQITATTRPATSSNMGMKTSWKAVLPHTIAESGACCVDVNSPPNSWFAIEFVRNKVATTAQNEDLIAYLQALVFDDQFLSTLRGQSLR